MILRHDSLGLFAVALIGSILCADASGQMIWSQHPATGPSARIGPIVFDATRQNVLMFDGALRGDHWEWNGATWNQLRPPNNPGARLGHAMVFELARGSVLLYGGEGAGQTVLSDTWEWDGATWSQLRPPNNPGTRRGHEMVYDARRQRVVLFGGCAPNCFLPDGQTWEWDGANWADRSPSPSPPNRTGHALAYDMARGVAVLFGGLFRDPTTYQSRALSDTWEWDGAAWRRRNPGVSPPARINHTLTWDSARERCVLYGGLGRTDTWEWDGVIWRDRTAGVNPGAREGAKATYDAARGQVVLFGGYLGQNPDNRTWTLQPNVRGGSTLVGAGCSGSAGVPTIAAPSPAVVGDARFVVRLGSLRPNSTSFLGISTTAGSVSFGRCVAYPSLPFLATAQLTSNGSGEAEYALPIPFDASLVGVVAHGQGGVLDPSGTLFGAIAMTPGLRIAIGD